MTVNKKAFFNTTTKKKIKIKVDKNHLVRINKKSTLVIANFESFLKRNSQMAVRANKNTIRTASINATDLHSERSARDYLYH